MVLKYLNLVWKRYWKSMEIVFRICVGTLFLRASTLLCS